MVKEKNILFNGDIKNGDSASRLEHRVKGTSINSKVFNSLIYKIYFEYAEHKIINAGIRLQQNLCS